METWSAESLAHLSDAQELFITALATDGSPRPEVPIWVVTADGRVFVRTWYRRTTGWFGHAVASGRARIRVPGLTAEVRVDDLGTGLLTQRDAIDAAYRAKYARYGEATVTRMLGAEAVSTTLELLAEQQEPT